ncbi:maternal protein tudor-like [Dysidea avara]|uniref:maternal protein tudor-like n=1 Tax=Dysidea avara TaxID=196820 RepID=UPI003324E531
MASMAGYKQVVLTNILPNGIFFLLPIENQDSMQLKEISHQMHTEFSSSSSRTYSPEPGAYCCALSKADSSWYRAIVKELEDETHCCVLFPDYGNEEIVPVERMRRAEDKYFHLPFLSQPCVLGDFVSRGNQWTPNLISVFQKTALNQPFFAHYHGFSDKTFPPLHATPQEVSLYQATGGSNDSVTDALIKLGYGFPTIPSLLCPISIPLESHVSYSVSPLDFWLQLDANSVLFENIHQQLNQKMKGQLTPLPLQALYPNVGCVVCINGNLCRAKIVSVTDKTTCAVLLVDSGETCSFPSTQLFSLLPEFFHMSAQATKCALYGVYPPDPPHKVNAMIERFKQLVTGASLTANFVTKDLDIHAVLLTDVTNGYLISDQLISEGLAQSQGTSVSQVTYITLESGNKENVLVTAIETPARMWCQLIRNTEEVDDLMEQLYSTYSTTSPQPLTICPGDVVAAQFTHDDSWYRAIIQKVTDDIVDVFYFDYGNSETIPINRLRELKPEFLTLPAQAVCFSLHGVDGDKQWTPSEIVQLEGVVLSKGLEMSVIDVDRSNGYPLVKLSDKMAGGVDISTLLSFTTASKGSQGKELVTTSGSTEYKRLSPAVGDKLAVQITYANSPLDFYCQLLQHAEQFEQLLSDINAYCESSEASVLAAPTKGASVLAQYDMDMVWYRGKVLEIKNETCKVLFVDYGNIEDVNNKKVYSMPVQYQQLPAQAINCSLEGLGPGVTAEQVETFEALVQQSLYCTINSVQQQNVYFVSLTSADDTPIAIAPSAVSPSRVAHGTTVPVYVTFCEGPDSFWCQRQEDEIMIQDLATQLNGFYGGQDQSEHQLLVPHVGMVCCARYSSDGNWYRAEITAVRNNDATLYFFDYGNHEEYSGLPSSGVRKLDGQFLGLPAFAIHCRLVGSSGYTDNMAVKFEEVVMSDVMYAKFLSVGQGGVMETELRESGPTGTTILDLLQDDSPTNPLTIPQLSLTIDNSVLVLVTAFATKSQFYCQLLSNDSYLTNFMNSLDSYYSQLRPADLACYHPTVGSYACGQFTENDCWYRIIIEDVKSDNEVSVMYVDYGNKEVLPLARIKQLLPKFVSCPLQAIRCSIIGVDDSNAADGFGDFLLNKEFHMTAKQALKDGFYLVSLVGIDGNNVVEEATKLRLVVPMANAQPETSRTETQPGSGAQSVVPKSVTQTGIGLQLPNLLSKLEVGNIVDIMVTHVESPSHFYCSLLQFNDQLAAITDTIATSGVSAPPVCQPQEGTYCLAQYSEDEEWYRAYVISVDTNEVTVQFVDYGNVERVAISDLKCLEDAQLCSTPKQAIKCGLARVRPSMGYQWTAGSCDFIVNTLLDKTLVALVHELSPERMELILTTTDDKDISSELITAGHAIKQTSVCYKELALFPNVPYSLYVCYVNSSTGHTWCQLASCVTELNKLMDQLVSYCPTARPVIPSQVSIGLACCVLFEDGGWYRAQVINFGSNSMVEVLLVDFGNTTSVKVNELKEIKLSQLVFPKQAFCCAHSSLTEESEVSGVLIGRMNDGVWNMKLTEEYRSGEVSKQEELVTVAKVNLFQKSSEVEVVVSHVLSPVQFYCQPYDLCDQLYELSTQLQSYGFDSMATLDPQEGVYCAARYVEDNQWYRAKVTSIASQSVVCVLFVDYGNTEKVDCADVRPLPAVFTDLPSQACCCSLPNDMATTIDLDSFTNTVLEQQFKAVLVDTLADLTNVVKLHTSSGELLFASQCTVSPLVLSVGTVHAAYLCHVESPSQFYCQLHCNVSDLTLLQDQLADKCNQKNSAPQKVQKGIFCAACYTEDHEWYRAEVVSVHGNQALVRFCDYGNTDTVNIKGSLVTLDNDMTTLPGQAVLCSLAENAKLSPSQLASLVDQEVILSIQKITRDGFHLVQIEADKAEPSHVPPLTLSINNHLPVVVTHCVSSGEFYCQDQRHASELEQLLSTLCELEAGASPSEVTIGLHCAACYSEDGQWYRAEVRNVIANNISVIFLDYGNDDTITIDNLRCLTPDLCQLPAQAFLCSLHKSLHVKPITTDSESVFYSQVLNQEFTAIVTGVASDGVTHIVKLEGESGNVIDDDSLNLARPTPPASIPDLQVPLNVVQEVSVVYVASPSELYCQLTSNLDTIDDLMGQLENTTGSGHVTSHDVGSYCASKYSEDGAWYRAKVLEAHGDNTLTVKFIDYGNTEVVDISETTPLKPALYALPAQAIQCSLTKDVVSTVDHDSFDASWVTATTSAKFIAGSQSDIMQVCLMDASGMDVAKSFSVSVAASPSSALPARVPLQSGSSTSVVVSHIESDGSFYCQLEDWLSELDELQMKLEEHSQGAGLLSSQSLQTGGYVVAEYLEDGQWYRAKLLEVNPDSTAIVMFVDYGNTETVNKMVTIPTSVVSIPPLAIKCCLQEGTELPEGEDNLTINISEVLPNNQYVVKLPTTQQIEEPTACDEVPSVPPPSTTSPVKEVKTLSTECLSVGTPCEVIVSHVEGPAMFYVQLLRRASLLDEVMGNLAEHCDNVTAATVTPFKGMICGALFGDDNTWYRARVVSLAGDDVTLFYVDYGNTDRVCMTDIRPISDELCVLPAQAIKCATMATINDDEFIDAVSNVECIVTATKVTAGNTHLVDMTTPDGQPFFEPPTSITTGPTVSITVETDTIVSQCLPVSSRVPMFVTYCVSPASFWCRPLSSCDQLDGLMAKMADYYNEHIKLAPAVDVGTIVAAQYSEDDSWYRAKVLEVHDDGVSVFFVDYGNSEVVKMNRIQPLDRQFLLPAAQAICCSITGEIDRTYRQDVVTLFIDTITDQEVCIEVQQVREDGRHIVQLETASGELLDHLFTPTPDGEDTTHEDIPLDNSAPNGNIPVDYQYPTIQLDEGNEVDVYISYVEGPASFFCQPLNLAGDLESMMQQLDEAMKEPHPLSSAQVGQVCASRYSQDEIWYRAVVTHSSNSDMTEIDDQQVTVNFVDYGNSEVTNVKNLAILPTEFLPLPAQAIRCSCVDSGVEKFPDQVVQQFKELILEGEQYTITVEQLLGYGKYYVLVSTVEGEVNVTELLQDTAGLAADVQPTGSPTTTSDDTPVVAMTAEEEQEEEMANRLLSLPITQHQKLSSDGSKESLGGSVGSLDDLQIPFQISLTPREVFMGNISHIENPSLFYVQRSDCVNELHTLESDIQEHCHDNPTSSREVWSAGSFLLAKEPGDSDNWHRAEVKETFLDGTYEVFFIDYGNTVLLTTDLLRACPDQCNALPMQAIACSLANVPRRESWPSYYRDLMEEFAMNKELRISVSVPGSQGMRPTVIVEAIGSGAQLSQKVLEKLQAECEVESTGLSLAEEDNDYLEPVAFTDEPALLATKLGDNGVLRIEDDDQDLEYLSEWVDVTEHSVTKLSVGQVVAFSRLYGKKSDQLIGCLQSAEWEGLMEQVSSYAESCPEIQSIDDVVTGQPIISHHTGTWHRAHVIEIDHTAKLLKIRLLDSQAIATVSLTDVRPMKSEFMLFPSQAVQCVLTGVEPLQYEWDKDCDNVLKVLTQLKRPLSYQVVDINPTQIVARIEDEDTWAELFVACCVTRVSMEIETMSPLLEHEQ